MSLKKKKYIISGPDKEWEIIINEDEMIVYDVCKIKDYEGGDYLPRRAKEMDYHTHESRDEIYESDTEASGC